MSAKVLESTYTGRNTLKITTRDDAVPMKEVPPGTELLYEGHVIQEIVNEQNGEVFQSIVVKTTDGKLYATRSESFIKKIHEIMEIVKDDPSDEPLILMITKGKSKNGREFVSCALA